jgi:transposase-like protein
MAKKQQTSAEREARWRSVVEGCAESGLTVSAYCLREGVSAWSYYHWRKRLAGKYRKEAGKRLFVPVKIQSAAVVSGGGVEVALRGGRVLRAESGYDEVKLARLAALLEAGSC